MEKKPVSDTPKTNPSLESLKKPKLVKEFTAPKLRRFRIWVKENQLLIFFIFSIIGLVYNLNRQSIIEERLNTAENRAIHRAETAYTILISGMLQSATIMETNLVEERQHNLKLIQCARKQNCSDEILVQKEQRPYVPMAQHYFNAKQQMIKESEGEDVLDK